MNQPLQKSDDRPFHEKLLDAGYKAFPIGPIDNHDNAEYALQKRIRGEDGETRYFINVYIYDFRNSTRMPESMRTWSHNAEAILYTKNAGTEPVGFDLHPRFQFELVESMEAWFSYAYHQLKCVPDPHN